MVDVPAPHLRVCPCLHDNVWELRNVLEIHFLIKGVAWCALLGNTSIIIYSIFLEDEPHYQNFIIFIDIIIFVFVCLLKFSHIFFTISDEFSRAKL